MYKMFFRCALLLVIFAAAVIILSYFPLQTYYKFSYRYELFIVSFFATIFSSIFAFLAIARREENGKIFIVLALDLLIFIILAPDILVTVIGWLVYFGYRLSGP